MKYITILMMFSYSSICNHRTVSLNGTWVNKEDKDYIISINNEIFSEKYKEKITTYKCVRSSIPCDSTYMDDVDNHKLDFISLDDGRCFEITGITKTTLSYRYTVSGKLQMFFKK